LTTTLAALAVVGGAEERRASGEEAEQLPAELVELATTLVLNGGFTELAPCPRDNELRDEYVEFIERQLASVAPTSREAVRSR
jgi:hypothetical protein